MRRLLLISTACLATVACVRTTTDPVTGRMDVDVESPTQQGEQWRATLAGQGAGSAITGDATARVIAGTTTTTINLRGAMAGGRHPWHVHSGSCGSGGPIVGDPGAYQPIAIGENGAGTSSAQIALQLNEAERYHVNVHASASDMATIVACGDLKDE
jgi:hypothetical protein